VQLFRGDRRSQRGVRQPMVIEMARPQSSTLGHGSFPWLGSVRRGAAARSAAGDQGGDRRRRRSLAAGCLLAASPVWSDTFSAAHYDPKTDELVVTIVYGGSNPDHQFSVKWGECQIVPGGGNMHQTVLDVLDSQWNDASQQTYTKTVRFSLAGVSCRPAKVTLRTAPKYEMTLQIP
jgi:hypothetical protein